MSALKRRLALTNLHQELVRWKQVAIRNYELVKLQATLLSDAGDIFDQVNLGAVWQRTVDRHIGMPSRVINGVGVYGSPAAVVHQREAYDTLTAQETA
jgi:hypothetical protein